MTNGLPMAGCAPAPNGITCIATFFSADSSSTGSATFTAAAVGYPSAAVTVSETSSGGGGGGPAPQLHVSGNKLLNASGQQVILRGVDSADSKTLMYSTVHGAGRVMSRTQAKGKTNRRTGELVLDANGKPVKPRAVTHEMMDGAVKGVELRGGDVDEAPQVYKRLPEVLEHQGNTIKVEHRLTPIGVAMAPSGVFDPFKD